MCICGELKWKHSILRGEGERATFPATPCFAENVHYPTRIEMEMALVRIGLQTEYHSYSGGVQLESFLWSWSILLGSLTYLHELKMKLCLSVRFWGGQLSLFVATLSYLILCFRFHLKFTRFVEIGNSSSNQPQISWSHFKVFKNFKNSRIFENLKSFKNFKNFKIFQNFKKQNPQKLQLQKPQIPGPWKTSCKKQWKSRARQSSCNLEILSSKVNITIILKNHHTPLSAFLRLAI